MRKLGLVMVGLVVAGCPQNTITPANDLSQGDLAVPGDGGGDGAVDMNVGDMAMPSDMRLPLDAMRFVTYSEYLENVATARCMNLITCARLSMARLDACKASAKAAEPASFDISGEISKQRLRLNDILCVNARMNARCDGTDVGAITEVGPCGGANFYIGLVTPGNPCLASVECSSGYCDHLGPDGGTIDGGTFYNGCPNGVCKPFKSNMSGDRACLTFGSIGESPECNPFTSFCNPSEQCEALRMAGEDCTSVFRCRPGLYCKGGIYGSPTKCFAPSASGGDGVACDDGQIVTDTPPCQNDFFCSHEGVPLNGPGVCRPKKTLNQPCNTVFLHPQGAGNVCADGLHCYGLDGEATTCRALAGISGPCNPAGIIPPFNGCQDTLYCVSNTSDNNGTCQPMPSFGQGCTPQFTGIPCLSNAHVFGATTCLPNAAGSDAGTCLPMHGWSDRCDPATYAGVDHMFDDPGPPPFELQYNRCFTVGVCEPPGSPSTSRCLNFCP